MKFSFFKKQTPEKKFQELLDKYQQTAELNPDDIRIRIKIAELYTENNKKKEATEQYLLAAKAYEGKRLFQIAVAIYNHIISINPAEVAIYSDLADLHLKNGFIGDCVAVLEKLANYYYDNDMRYESTNVLQKISRIDPENKFFKIKIAKFYETKDLSEEETLREGPKGKWELTETQDSSKAIKDSEETFFDLQSALQDDVSINISTVSEPEDTETPQDTVMAPADVFSELKTIMESEPEQETPEYHYNLGLAYQRCSKTEEALDELEKALDGLTDKSECLLKLAECCMSLNRLDDAMRFANRGLKLKPQSNNMNLEFNYQTALINKTKGDNKKALKIFKKIYDSDKNFKSVKHEINALSKQ